MLEISGPLLSKLRGNVQGPLQIQWMTVNLLGKVVDTVITTLRVLGWGHWKLGSVNLGIRIQFVDARSVFGVALSSKEL